MGSVMIMAGGTGGHIFPALAVAKLLQQDGREVFWLGSNQGLETKLVPEHGLPLETIAVRGLRGNGLLRQIQAPIQLALAFAQTWHIIRKHKPAVALGMGGFATGPGGIVARLMGIPLIIHEQNSIPGLTNRWLAKLARRVYEAFPGSFPAAVQAITCGNPVRATIVNLPSPAVRWAERGGVGYPHVSGCGPMRLLVLGGSQGAKAINEILPQALSLLPVAIRPQVRHQTGPSTLEATQRLYQAQGITAEVTAFISDMAEAYAWADLAIARAGALTLSELAAAGLGSLLVPFPHAVDDHQTHNAAWLVNAGAAKLLPQRDLTATSLATTLRPLLEDRGITLKWATAARSMAKTAAAETIAQACMELMVSASAK